MRVAAVVANWNGGEENIECLASLLRQGLEPRDVVFIDNGSIDGSLPGVRGRFPEITIRENPENRGYCVASNQGAVIALERGAEAVFFVNNDVVLPDGVLAELVAVLEADPELGIVGPRVLYKSEPERIWSAGGQLTWRQNLSTLMGHGSLDGPHWRTRKRVDYLPGCSILVRRGVFEAVGFLDQTYFAYMEDIDYCLRARQAGYGVYLVGDLAVFHTASSSTGGGYNPRRKYMMGVNSVWFLKRHAHFTQWVRFFLFDVATLPLLWLPAMMRGEGSGVLGKALGILDGLRGKHVTGKSIEQGSGWLW